jgi:hypothetical protein
MLKLMEECAGVGALVREQDVFHPVPYRISRYQHVLPGSGMPVPGLHRIEGTVDLAAVGDAVELVGVTLTLRLEDGRALGITLADRHGRVVTEGRGPIGCSCC